MIRILVTYHCKPGQREAFLDSLVSSGLAQKCREDEGNIQYEYYRSVDREDELFLYEKWEDAEALTGHIGQPHMKEIGACKEKFVEDTEIVKIEE